MRYYLLLTSDTSAVSRSVFLNGTKPEPVVSLILRPTPVGIPDLFFFFSPSGSCFKKAVKDYGAGRGGWDRFIPGCWKFISHDGEGPWTINENSLA